MDAVGRIILKLQALGRRGEELAARAKASPSANSSAIEAAIADIRQQLASLAGSGFVSKVGLDRLPDIERYLSGVDRRLEKLPAEPRRDFALTQRAQALERQLAEAMSVANQDGTNVDSEEGGRLQALEEARWMIEELRVSFFAQSLGTRVPVSEQKIMRLISQALQGQ